MSGEQRASIEFAKPLQEDFELRGLIDLLVAENVRSYLEVGVRYGGTFEQVMMAMPRGAHGVAVDFPGGNFGDPESATIMLAAIERVRQSGSYVNYIFGPSSAPEVVARAEKHAPYDAAFIDADHSYEAVRRDFAIYAPMARMVILHDIAAPASVRSRNGLTVEVPRFWTEIKGRYRHREITSAGTVMGLGVVWMP